MIRFTVEWKVRPKGADCEPFAMPAVVTGYTVPTAVMMAKRALTLQGFECVEPFHVTIGPRVEED